ncbi:MAG: hypothetical protein NTZ05_11855, partial [Chloroflexi bacterium]|nr:hypothetical protein [Chloroflexota bacterium]
SLEDAIAASVFPWTRIAFEALQFVQASQVTPELLDHVKGADVETLADIKAGLLGPSYEQFLGAYASFKALTVWGLENVQAGGSAAQKVSIMENLIGETLLRTQITIFTVVLVLQDAIVDWLPGSIPMLCDIADEYMNQIENIFDSLIPEAVIDNEVVEYDRN